MSPFIHLPTTQGILWEGDNTRYLPDLEPGIGRLMGSEPSILRSEVEFSKMGTGRCTYRVGSQPTDALDST